jgi:hypothetical protein
VQDAILLDMRKRPKWANVTSLPAAFGSLLASAGGRPRDIESIVMAISMNVHCIDKVNHDVLLPLLSSLLSCSYLLPSLLNVQFRVRAGTNATQFGLDVTSRALCNSDLLAPRVRTLLHCRCAFSHASRASCSRFLSVS